MKAAQTLSRIGGMAVAPGDLLHADCNGVVNIPLEIAADVADAAGEFVRAEAIMLEYLACGKVDIAGVRAARSEIMAAMSALGKRVRSREARV